MDPELIERLNEQFREMSELLSQQNATMAAQLRTMQAQAGATTAATNARNSENAAINQNTNTIGENTKKQEAYAIADQQREKQKEELHAAFRSAMQGTIGSLTSFKDALLGTERGFSKYGNAISGLGDAAWDLGKNFGMLGGALGGLAKGVGMAAGAVLQQTDNMNNFADTFKNMGAVGGTTNTKLLEMAQAAGYASQDLAKLSKPIATLGSAITNIGGTAQAGQQAFMNIINIGEDARKKFNRLGMQIEDVNDAQANYIALQRLSGNAFSNSAKDQDKLRKTSLEYTENLVELAALTGTDIETLKKKQQIAYQEYQELVTTQAENARIAELRKKVAETGDKDLAAELKRLEARAAARDQVKQETDELFGGAMGAQIRDYLRSGGRVSETNIGAYQLAGKELEQLRKMYESGASREEMSTFMRDNLRQAMKEGVGERATQFGGTINVMDPRAAEELGNVFGLDKELMTKLGALGEKTAGEATKEGEAGVKTAGEEGFDKAADSRAALTELEIKAKVALDKLLLSINPLANGFDAGTVAALALAAAATGAAIALGRMALASRMGGLPGGAGPAGGGKPGTGAGAGGTPGASKVPAKLRQADIVDKSGKPLKGAALDARLEKLANAERAAQATTATKTTSRLTGALSKGGRLLGRLATPLMVAGGAYEAYSGYKAASEEEKAGKINKQEASAKKGEAIGSGAGGVAGGLAGAKLGAMLGAAAGPLGILAGGLIGGGLGYFAGSKLGGSAGSAVGGLTAPKPEEQAAIQQEKAAQARAASQEAQKAKQSEQVKMQTDQFNKAVANFGSLIISFAKTVTAFAVTTKAFAMSTKKFAETVNSLTRINTIGSTIKSSPSSTRSTALDNLVAGTIGEAEEALTPMQEFQRGLSDSSFQMKYLREEELKRHRFTELSMSIFRKSVEEAAKKLDQISGYKRGSDTDGGGSYTGDVGEVPQDVQGNLESIAVALRKKGFGDENYINAVLGNVMKESGGRMDKTEDIEGYSNTDNARIRNIFKTKTRGMSDAELDALKADPQAFANKMYGDRGGNREPGDGWKYRGRGPIQLTGRANYAKASKDIFGDDRLVQNPDLVLQPDVGVQVVAWFMHENEKSMRRQLGFDKNQMLSKQEAALLATSQIAGQKITRGAGYLGTENLSKVESYASAMPNKVGAGGKFSPSSGIPGGSGGSELPPSIDYSAKAQEYSAKSIDAAKKSKAARAAGRTKEADTWLQASKDYARASKGMAEKHKLISSKPDNVHLTDKANISGVRQDLLAKFFTAAKEFGGPIRINSAYRDDQYQAELWVRGRILGEPGIHTPARPKNDTTVNVRGKQYEVQGSGKGSKHGRGEALDISADFGRLDPYLSQVGLTRPFKGDDPPHVELQARKGGVFDGPDTGYPVELHGGEMITPLNMDSVLMKLAKTPADTPAGEMMEKMVQGPQAVSGGTDVVEKVMQMHTELVDVLARKLDNMLDKLDDGNDTRQKILKNSQT